ncbi:lipase [Helicobacter bilis]|uniref:GPI inositol-deacylase PGAP1-like alpha/beta domain-containing protein n=2 Tax=Helicobacter bilis TaxID=37372 RepID=C3XIN3_9HELI|nr:MULTISPECIES: lipase [Helicobacter]AQQ59232.1 lipase [Helicobacter bilis]EEO24872.1 hypothetical protein HRAG_01929 [Helicobacter bilis ATCC 43879]
MAKNIQTHNAKAELVKKFLDYANIADSSYALLHYIKQNAKDEKEVKADSLTFGDKLEHDIEVLGLDNKPTIKPKGTNTAYACAIEARFNADKVIRQEKDRCIPAINTCFGKKDITLHNDITKVGLHDTLSKRTIAFTNRFRILAHQENTSSGFSATLFEDTEDNNQKIFAIRGTEFPSGFFDDVLDSDANLVLSSLPSNQYIDMLKFYCACIDEKHVTESTPLIIVGHSLGGCLAQLFTLSLATAENANNVKEVYTFNSPGAKNLRIDNDKLGKVYKIVSAILTAKDKEMALFKKIRGYEYGEKSGFLRDTTLIGYDNGLLNEIHKYFTNNENLKEHSILVRTFSMPNMSYMGNGVAISSVTYTYKIFSVNEIFIKCLNTLKANNLLKQPLACQDSIHHIESDDDSNPDNNQWQDELIQNLGTDIDGKHYYINLGAFSGSHFILPTIHSLQKALMHMNSGNVDNLLEYNKIKDLKDESMFLRMNRNRKDEQISQMQANVFNSLQNLRY